MATATVKGTVVRNGSHQGVPFVEVQRFDEKGLGGPLVYAIPGDYPLGTEVEIAVTTEDEKPKPKAAEKGK